MRIARYFPVFFLLFLYIDAAAQTQQISGKVVRYNNGVVLPDAVVQINFNNRQSLTDSKGYFHFDSLPDGNYMLKVYHAGFPVKEMAVTLTNHYSAPLVVVMAPPCAYDEHKKDNTCPVCHTPDNVVPIRWGLVRGKMDTAHYYYGGCKVTYCDPNWYCKFDRKLF